MIIRKIVLITIVLMIFSFNVYGANITDAYKWLNQQTPSDVYGAGFNALALREVSGGSKFVEFLESKQDPLGCWPISNCNAKDTAISTLVFNKEGRNIDQSLEWLKNHQDITLTGEWLLQIKTQSSGECDIEYFTSSESATKKKITVDQGFISSEKCASPTTFFNIGNCLESNLLSTKTSLDFDIKCPFDGVISSLYNEQGIYYLIDDAVTGGNAKIKINNGDFGNYKDTLLINWVLKELDSDVDSLTYLRKNYKNDVESNAFLYLITGKNLYANELSNLQKDDGSFGNIFETAIALLALDDNQHQSQLELGRKWLDNRQDKQGSWNSNIIDTAIVLYSAYPKEGVNLGEERTVIPEEQPLVNCNNDGLCDTSFGENSLQCPLDCRCGDGICDISESSTTCSLDCEEPLAEEPKEEVSQDEVLEEEKGSGFIWFILILIFIGGLAFFGYKRFGKDLFKFKKKEKPSFSSSLTREEKPEFKRPIGITAISPKVQKERKSETEEALEKSLREAKKILGK